jgi:hypothetical protein
MNIILPTGKEKTNSSNTSARTTTPTTQNPLITLKTSLPSITNITKKIIDHAVHRKIMKTPDHNRKYKSHTQKNSSMVSNKSIVKKSHQSSKSNIGKKIKTRKPHIYTKHPDYLQKLVNNYYDNDASVKDYLEHAHKKLHIKPSARRVIVIGDIHGDLDVAIKCLILAKCIQPITPPYHKTIDNMNAFFESLIWTGVDTQIVQLGDQIDRVRPQSWDRNSLSRTSAYEDEGSTLEIFYLFWHLNNLAQKQGGAVWCIIGNHEIMNIDGDFRYVSTEEFRCFKDHLAHVYYPNSKYPYHSRTIHNTQKTRKSGRLPIGYRERLYAFSPTGLCANFIAHNYYSMLQIGNWLFCHGSPTMEAVQTYPIDLLNTVASMYLLGLDSNELNIENHFDKIMKDNDDNQSEDSTSIIWSRTFGDQELALQNTENHEKKQTIQTQANINELLDKILTAYNKKNNNNTNQTKVTHIAIGHTPQFQGSINYGINSICGDRVWRCDIGMSKAFINGSVKRQRPIQVLEIIAGLAPRVLSSYSKK